MLNNFMAGIFYSTFRYVFFMSKPTQTFVISVNRHRKTFPRLMFSMFGINNHVIFKFIKLRVVYDID